MASSGVTAYTYTRDQIINAALRKLSVLSEGVSANATQLSTGAEALNLLILQYQALGMPLWSRKVKTTTMVSGTSSYTLSSPKPLKVFQAYFTDATTNERRDIMNFATDDRNTQLDDYWVPSGLMPMSQSMVTDAQLEEEEKKLGL